MLSGFGAAHKLPVAYKITALSQIMKHKKDKFEEFEDQSRDLHPNDDEQQYELIFAKVLEFATRRRLDANQARMKEDLMDCNRVGPEADQPHGCQHQDQQAYPEQYNYEGYDVYGSYNINEANYGGGVSPFNIDQHQQPSDIDAFGKGKGKGKGKDTRLCWICDKQGHISRDCRSPKATELRAKGVIKGSSKGSGGQWNWNKGKGKGKGKYGGKGEGVYEMEWAWEDKPEEENGGEIQALGGGIQIASIQQFPKPINQKGYRPKGKGKGKGGKGKFRPKQTQNINTFLKPPPGIDHGGYTVAEHVPSELGRYSPTGTYLYADNEAAQHHCGLDWDEIKTWDIDVISKDIELAINGIDQVIESGWEKIKVSVDSAAVDTVAPPHVGKSIPLRENEMGDIAPTGTYLYADNEAAQYHCGLDWDEIKT